MQKYLILYHSENAPNGPGVTEMFANTPPERLRAGMEMWNAWHQKSGHAIKDMGAPLDHSNTVTKDSVAPSKTTVTGFCVLEAASMEEAAGLVKGHPHFFAPGASVQVLEFVKIPGM